MADRPAYPVIRHVVDGRQFLGSPLTRLRVQRKSVHPSRWRGELWMRCERCGGLSYKPIMRPVEGGSARVVALVCDDSRGGGCLAVYKLDLAGCLEKGGTVDGKPEKAAEESA